jgi:uncharacterized protein YlzI (FlbEa/FlbD family)
MGFELHADRKQEEGGFASLRSVPSACQKERSSMIHLTRLNNQPFVVNADLIKFIENAPDTVITLLTGEKLVVLESADEVLKRIGEFHERFYRRAGPGIVFDTSLPGGTSGAAEAVIPPVDAPRGKKSLGPHPRPRDEKT